MRFAHSRATSAGLPGSGEHASVSTCVCCFYGGKRGFSASLFDSKREDPPSVSLPVQLLSVEEEPYAHEAGLSGEAREMKSPGAEASNVPSAQKVDTP